MKYLPGAAQGHFTTVCRLIVSAPSPFCPPLLPTSLMVFKSRNVARALQYSQKSDMSHPITMGILRMGPEEKRVNSLSVSNGTLSSEL